MILVTGAAGFIGSNFINLYLDNSYNDLILIDNFSNSSVKSIYDLEKKHKIKLNFNKIDLLDTSSLENLFNKYSIDTIIHFAGLKSVSQSVLLSAKYYYNNVIGSKLLFKLAKKFKVKNLIFSSSATVYGAPVCLPLDENHPIRATNPYGQNKIDIEEMLIKDKYFQTECSVKILRYFNPVGAHSSGMFGDYPVGIPNNLMPYILKVAKNNLPLVNVFGNDYSTHDGTGVRDYIHIMDLADGHISALNYSRKGVSIFNLGTGKGYSVLDLIHTFQNVNKIKIPYKFVDRRSGDVDEVFANPSKAIEILEFKSKLNLEQMCFDAWNFEKNK